MKILYLVETVQKGLDYLFIILKVQFILAKPLKLFVTHHQIYIFVVDRFLKDLTQHVKNDHDKPEKGKRGRKKKDQNNSKKNEKVNETELLPYKCEFCSKRFKVKAKLLVHLKYELLKPKHEVDKGQNLPEEEEVSGNGRRQVCKLCSKSISGSLRRHLGMTHQIVIPYQCKLCPNIRFSYRPNFQAHVDHSHSTLTVFQCLEKTFAY